MLWKLCNLLIKKDKREKGVVQYQVSLEGNLQKKEMTTTVEPSKIRIPTKICAGYVLGLKHAESFINEKSLGIFYIF